MYDDNSFLMGANLDQFDELATDLKRSYIKNKTNKYPKNPHSAYTFLNV